jgi:membrane-associated phospholipid phosphatase
MTPATTPWAAVAPLQSSMPLADGDARDFRKVNDFARHTTWLHGPAVTYANDGVVLFGVLLLIGWWLARRAHDPRRMARALLAPVAVLIAVAVNQQIVHAVNEPRPYTALAHTLLLVHRSADASFPSDHATMAGAVAAGLLLVSVRLGLIATAAALLMAFTRVYVGAHYPIDVLAGLAVGATVGTVVCLGATSPVHRLVAWAASTPLRPLITGTASTEHPSGRQLR